MSDGHDLDQRCIPKALLQSLANPTHHAAADDVQLTLSLVFRPIRDFNAASSELLLRSLTNPPHHVTATNHVHSFPCLILLCKLASSLPPHDDRNVVVPLFLLPLNSSLVTQTDELLHNR